MRVLRLHPDRTVRLHDEPEPEPGPGEALVRVTSVGLCGSDRHWLLEGGIGDARLTQPVVPGHEFGGIAETGRFRGRRVAVDPAAPCWECELCATGRENLCLRIRFAGYAETDGALRELVAWPERSIHQLSDDLDDSVECLIEPLAIGIHAIDLAQSPGGSLGGARVAVLGAGPIGLMIIALARRAGAASILATDPLPHRQDAARAFGATTAVTGPPEPREAAFDIVFEAAGEQAAVDDAIDLAAPGGTVVLVGIPAEEQTSFRAAVARRKGLVLKLTRRSTVATFRRAVRLAEDRALDLPALVTRRVPLEDFEDGIRALIDRAGLKVVIEPRRTTTETATAEMAEVRAG
jgi:L-iditol 2-dehydrogenase